MVNQGAGGQATGSQYACLSSLDEKTALGRTGLCALRWAYQPNSNLFFRGCGF